MALFGKKKPAAVPAPQPNPEDYIQVAGGDGDETGLEEAEGGQVIDFDAIAQDLNSQEADSTMDAFLGRNADSDVIPDASADPVADASHGGAAEAASASNLDDEIDFGTSFDAGTPVVPVATTETASFSSAPDFGSVPDASQEIHIEPVVETPIALESPVAPVNAPPMIYTAPILTSDLAANGSAPAMKKSVPLPMILGAIGLLAALGGVGYWVTSSKPEEPAPIVASAPAPGVADTTGAMPVGGTAPAGSVAAPGGPAGAVNQGIAVDGVPIAPGVVVQQAPVGFAPGAGVGTAPATAVGTTDASVTPAVKAQLRALWKQGADAKHSGDFAGARSAWMQMQTLRPGNADVQSAIDKLPPA